MATRARMPMPATKLMAFAGALGYLALCLPGASAAPIKFWDTADYAWVAEHLSPFSGEFFAARKPFTTPLLFWLARGDYEAISVAQILISAAAWLAMASALPRLFSSTWARAAAFILPLLLSLSWPVRSWNYCLLSESLCFSLMAAVLATSIWAILPIRHSMLIWATWAVLLVLWGGTRDTIAYAIGIAGVVLLLWVALVWLRARAQTSTTRYSRSALMAGAFLVCLALGFCALTQKSGRWKLNVLNVVHMRVLPDVSARSEWVDRFGMPDSPSLRTFAGRWPWDGIAVSHANELYDIVKVRHSSPELLGFHAWLEERGLESTRNYVLRHPLHSVGMAIGDYVRLPEYDQYLSDIASPPLSRAAAWIFFPAIGWEKMLLFIPVLIGSYFGRMRSALLWSAILGASAAVQLLVSYHGDPHNLVRHTSVVGILLRLALVVLFCGALDARRRSLVRIRQEKPHSPGARVLTTAQA